MSGEQVTPQQDQVQQQPNIQPLVQEELPPAPNWTEIIKREECARKLRISIEWAQKGL